ncbi:helix-turn-helix domain-containing protein [Streptomyces albus]|uniref:helix-turn-helix domain-containing protein n=1 Tax=Streptomyces albus TaxID=1888 RepID=UPI0004CBE6D1|nr:helix-turn-helix transcriptional regulator [Streptomyces albus]
MLESNNLGAMLRQWRDRTTPGQAGVQSIGRRRVPGLRREELGRLAGVSADYIKRLEQGQGHPSREVLEALARALRLGREDYEYLCVLAGYSLTGDGCVPQHIGGGAQRLLDRLNDVPVCVCDATWTVIAWNDVWGSVMGCGPVPGPGRERNVAWRLFVGTPGSIFRSSGRTARFESTVVADLRRAVVRYPADARLSTLVGDLISASSRFRSLWEGRADAPVREERVTVRHPDMGDILVDCDTLSIDDGDLRFILFTAEPGSAEAQRLALAGTVRDLPWSAHEKTD